MKYTKSILGMVTVAALFFTSCENSNLDIENSEEVVASFSEDLTQEDLVSVIETLSIKYPITAVNNENNNETINSDSELEEFGKRTKRPRIDFPIEVTVDGSIVTINSPKELKRLLTKRAHRKAPFKLVFPVTVINADASTTVIADKEAMKAYKETLEEGVKPTFQFPISIQEKDGSVIEMENEEALTTYLQEKREAKKTDRKKKSNKKRSPFQLVFPVTVINADATTTVIADKEAMKAYRETLEEGVKPTFQFPISIQEKDGSVIEMENEEALTTYLQEKKEAKNERR